MPSLGGRSVVIMPGGVSRTKAPGLVCQANTSSRGNG